MDPVKLKRRIEGGWEVHPVEARSHPTQLRLRPVRLDDLTSPLLVGSVSYSCDGSGGCCSQYLRVVLQPGERDALIELLTPVWDEDFPIHEAFLDDDGVEALATRDGRCVFQLPDGRCLPHSLGGPRTKPLTCRRYPLGFYACGDHWQLAQGADCACAARTSVIDANHDADAGDFLGLRHSVARVYEVPAQLVGEPGGEPVERADYLRWVALLAEELPVADDPVSALELGAAVFADPLPAIDAAWLRAIAEGMTDDAERLTGLAGDHSARTRAASWLRDLASELAAAPAPLPEQAAESDGRVLSLAVADHRALMAPDLRSAVADLARVARLARIARAHRPAEQIDRRLDTLPALLLLWQLPGWPRGWGLVDSPSVAQ